MTFNKLTQPDKDQHNHDRAFPSPPKTTLLSLCTQVTLCLISPSTPTYLHSITLALPLLEFYIHRLILYTLLCWASLTWHNAFETKEPIFT